MVDVLGDGQAISFKSLQSNYKFASLQNLNSKEYNSLLFIYANYNTDTTDLRDPGGLSVATCEFSALHRFRFPLLLRCPFLLSFPVLIQN